MSRCEYLFDGWYLHIFAEVTFFLAKVIFFPKSSGSKSHAGVTNEQDCNYAFDGEGGTLAHAYFPQDGRVHFDNDERYSENGGTTGWWWSEKVYQSLSYVALHEFGHTLGLGHSDNDDAVMWPYARTGNPSLHSDDISGIQSLYGEQMSDIRNILLWKLIDYTLKDNTLRKL